MEPNEAHRFAWGSWGANNETSRFSQHSICGMGCSGSMHGSKGIHGLGVMVLLHQHQA
jgi:hypothetical protein